MKLRLYHGCSTARQRLDPCQSANRAVFGPGLYLTARPKTAAANAKGADAVVHVVDMELDDAAVADLGRPFAEQSPICQKRLRTVFWDLPHHDLIGLIQEREQHLLDWLPSGQRAGPCEKLAVMKEIRAALSTAGVQLLHGHCHPSEYSGECDRGRQFVWLGAALAPAGTVSVSQANTLINLEQDVEEILERTRESKEPPRIFVSASFEGRLD